MATKTVAHKVNEELHSENGTGQSLLEKLREKSRLRTRTVYVARWEVDIVIRELSPIEAQEMGKALKDDINAADPNYLRALAELISRSCVKPAFSVDDLMLLMGDDMSLEPIKSLAQHIVVLNKLGEDGVKQTENSFPDPEGRRQ